MRKLIAAIMVLLNTLVVLVMATGCSSGIEQDRAKLPEEVAPDTAVLPVIGPAPAWDNDDWINAEDPILLQDLRGKAVLLEFSTSL